MTSSHNQPFRNIYFMSKDGLRLHARDYPSKAPLGNESLPVVCLPGLSRNVRDFHHLALMLSHHPVRPRRVIAVDYRGRGLSQYDPTPKNYNVMMECEDVIALCDMFGLKQGIFVGTSRGGLILHLMTVLRPDLITATVLNDIGPQLEAQGLMEIRDYLGRRSTFSSFDEAASALMALHGESFTALAIADWLDMAHALYIEHDGSINADYDPALNDQFNGIDFSKPLPTLWSQFETLAEKPMLVIRGENSKLFSSETVAAMKRGRPSVTTYIARGQGHAPLLHHDSVFPAIEAFFASK